MTQFHNRIRLPIKIFKPQFPTTREIYRKANGESVVQSVVIKKTYEGTTDYLSERLHERFKIALEHDFLQIETENYFGRLVASGDYNIAWLEFMEYPISRAKFEVEVTPFNATNSNCQTCENANQIVANDDFFYPDLNEDTDYTLDLSTNDEICCFPVTWSLISFNSAYLTSASIDSSGVLSIHTGTGLVSANNIKLATYRATCPNGGYDEADVFANISGSVAGCLAPTAISMFETSTVHATVAFTPPSPLPDHYHWFLYNNVTHVIDQTDDAPSGSSAIAMTGLTPGNSYRFYIRSQCDATNDDATASNYIFIDFTTAPITTLCGTYALSLSDPTQPDAAHGGHASIPYVDCNGNNQTLYLPNNQTRQICAMQTSPGSPTSIDIGSNPYVTITYIGICGNPRPVLTFSFVNGGGSFLQFEATLSFAIDGVVNITKVFADGFSTSDCSGGAVASAQRNSLMSIPSGLTGAGAPPDSPPSGTWASAVKYTMYNVIVNSTPLVDGDSIIIGSYTVDVVIPFCI